MKTPLNKCLAIVPARFASTRFPGKPLAMLGGRTVIERVARQIEKAGIKCVVATDDSRIFNTVEELGLRAVMTDPNHKSGTDRIEEAANILHTDAEIIINVQGDEPFIRPQQILSLIECFDNPDIKIATLAKPFDSTRPFEELDNPNLVKVVFDDRGKALYFSRSVIPYLRNIPKEEWPMRQSYFTHIGMYAYRKETLHEITSLPQSSLEIAESLEQLRWLQSGYSIGVAKTSFDTVGIDTPEDLREAEKFLGNNKVLFD